ncbi:unnamed protein product (macronuclear) [Paramecium tetraurelia]|uniref:Chromosome undetermined scaffold_1, whole genome shotgun sequence n=1 Tax=Paramecium tetraurelia TaxID=5888 RepID=Q6BGB7_PARTE|nr:hypothetical protein [Paramecium tetraurelia strain d4-2]XP_001423398.1 uncharacterized protein GSPATT00000435001 [Paramecium tetraurelia]CAH03303.1 hypothetical protein with coiled-coil domains [Paramecium tetraurelia]CAK56000.1 unnamed protein product [Paramecium tetraurelia]|eukprot:XP_001423398.1 hypothetical protein (macronuclear) [Paramecium tetraurelia strain d4-2]
MQQQLLNPLPNINEKYMININGNDILPNSGRKSSQYDERPSEQRRREEQKQELSHYRDLCEQLNKENLLLKSFQIENNELKQKQLLMNVELSAAQQELSRIRNQFGSQQSTDRQVQKIQQDNLNLQQQISDLNKQKQNLEAELKLFKENRLTQTIEIPDMNASVYQRKIKEMEEDIQILIDDYNSSQEKLEKALNEQKQQFKSDIDQLRSQNQLMSAEISGWQQRYNNLEIMKNELSNKLIILEKENQQLVYKTRYDESQANLEIISQLKDQITQQTKSITNLKAELQQKQQSESQLIYEQQIIKQKLEQFQTQTLNSQKIDNQQYKNEISKLKQEIEQLQLEQKDNDFYKTNIYNLKEEQLLQQIDSQQEEIKRLREELISQEEQHTKRLKDQEHHFQIEIKSINEKYVVLQNEINCKPQSYEESRIKFQTQLEVNNYEAQTEKLKRDIRQMEQQMKEHDIQVKLWQERFYEQQTQNEDLRYKHQELRNQISQYLSYKTQNEYDQKTIHNLEALVEEQQNIMHTLYQKEQHYKETITKYIQKIEEFQYVNNEESVNQIQQLQFQLDQLQIKIKEQEAQLNIKSTQSFDLETQIEIEKLKFSEREILISKQQKQDKKRIQQLELQVENLQKDYALLSQKKNEVIKEYVQVENQQEKERIIQLEQSLSNLQQEYVIMNQQYLSLQNQCNTLIIRSEQSKGSEEDKIKIKQLEEQLRIMKDQYFELNSLKQQVLKEVVKEVIEVPSESDQMLIKQLRQELQQLQAEYMILNNQKRNYVEVQSEVDKNRIKELERQLIILRQDYEEVCKKKQLTITEFTEVSSKQDLYRIQQLEKTVQQLQEENFKLQIQYSEQLKKSVIINQDFEQVQELQFQLTTLREENKKLYFQLNQQNESLKKSSSSDFLKIQQLEQKIRNLEQSNLELQKLQSQIKIVKETVEVSKDEDLFKIQQLELQLQLKTDDMQYLEKQLNLQKKNVEELISANEKMKYENTKMRSQLYELQSTVDDLQFKIKENSKSQEEIKYYQQMISQYEQRDKMKNDSQKVISELKSKLNESENQVKRQWGEFELSKQDYEFKLKSQDTKYSQQIQQLQQELQFKLQSSEQENLICKNTCKQIQIQNDEMQREIKRLSDLIRQKNDEIRKLNENIQIYSVKIDQYQTNFKENQIQIQENNVQQEKMSQLMQHCTKLENALKQFEEEKKIENKELHEHFNKKMMEVQEIIHKKDDEIQQLSIYIASQQQQIQNQELAKIQFARQDDNQQFLIELQNQLSIVKQELLRQTTLKEEYQNKNNELILKMAEYEQGNRVSVKPDYQLTERLKGASSYRNLANVEYNLNESQFQKSNQNQMRTRDSTSLYNPKPNNFNPLNSSIIKQKVFTQKKSQIY